MMMELCRRRVVLVTGLSGSGRTSILRALEDLGYEAVDNPPVGLIEAVVRGGARRQAIGVDVRSAGFDPDVLIDALARLRGDGAIDSELVYACADDEILLRRFTETRRRHPMAPTGRVSDGIAAERALTYPLREVADLVIDTTGLSLPALRQSIEARFAAARETGLAMTVALVSFAYPSGVPRDADLVFDARFLRNPHYNSKLRPLTGLDAEVAEFIQADTDFLVFFDKLSALLRLLLPRFVQEGKKYVTIAVGCTGGRHRSVYVVERLAASLAVFEVQQAHAGQAWSVTVMHRELSRLGIANAAADAGTPSKTGTAEEGTARMPGPVLIDAQAQEA